MYLNYMAGSLNAFRVGFQFTTSGYLNVFARNFIAAILQMRNTAFIVEETKERKYICM